MYVIFRRLESGDVIALFPEVAASQNVKYCQGHDGTNFIKADYQKVMDESKPAKSQEYRKLLKGLRKDGTELLLVQQESLMMHECRKHNSVGRPD